MTIVFLIYDSSSYIDDNHSHIVVSYLHIDDSYSFMKERLYKNSPVVIPTEAGIYSKLINSSLVIPAEAGIYPN